MTIQIIVRRWRDKCGITYHTVEIRRSGSAYDMGDDDRPSILSDVAYGYDMMWEETALDILRPLYGGPRYLGIWHWVSAFDGLSVEHTVIDVERKRDLLPHAEFYRQSRSSN